MGVGVWGFPVSSSVIQVVKAYLALSKVAPISASDAEDTTVLIRCHRVWMAPLLVGRVGGLLQFLASYLAREKLPRYWLCVRSSQR